MKKFLRYFTISLVSIILFSGCNSHPKITENKIQTDIVGAHVNLGSLDDWRFAENEPRIIIIIESKYDGNKATVIINMETSGRSIMGMVHMKGKLRLNYEWIAKEWNLIRVDSLTFRRVRR